jgi:NAD+ diphosphatase
MARYVPGFRAPDSDKAETLWLIFDAGGSVIRSRSDAGLAIGHCDVARVGVEITTAGLFLGTLDGRPCYAAELPAEFVPSEDEWEVAPLREVLGVLDDEEASLAAAARQLLQATHRYCGCCGEPMTSKGDERAKVCPSCGHTAFPRMNPAVIVAVRRGDALLLGRNRRYRSRRMFSLVAGFVEVGESLEQTVRREVYEESGLEIAGITYFGSQPWPFPSTLMLGFKAAYAGGDITLHDEELIEAGWFTPDDFPEIPRPGSISRALIDDFVRDVRAGQ